MQEPTIRFVTPDMHEQGIVLLYTSISTPFGKAWLASTKEAVYRLSFTDSEEDFCAELVSCPKVTLQKSPLVPFQNLVESWLNGEQKGDVSVALLGTDFQRSVWEMLIRVPRGDTTTYSDIARQVQRPKAVRAVGTAVGANPVAYLIPCHRVLRQDGGIGGYHWGLSRKEAMLARERAKTKAS